MEAAHGPTAVAGDVPARQLQLTLNLTRSCCDVHISVIIFIPLVNTVLCVAEQWIALPFQHCGFRGFFMETVLAANVTLMHSASGLQCIPGRVISMKLHPQEVLATKLKARHRKRKCSNSSAIHCSLKYGIVLSFILYM